MQYPEEYSNPPTRPHSFASSFAHPIRRRPRRNSQPAVQPPSNDKDLPPIPFAEPPFMPMYKPSSPGSPAKLLKLRAGGEEESLWSALPSTRPSSPKPAHSRTLSRERSSRFMRRLNRWTGGFGKDTELDFGCAGEWADGPADMGHRFYSHYPGGTNRTSTASSVNTPSSSHSRGHSTSSNYSVSTAASSVPPSPTAAACHFPSSVHSSSDSPVPLSPRASRLPLTPRTAQRKRQSDEDAAVAAVNDYFCRGRLSQIREDVSPRASLSGGSVRDGRSQSVMSSMGGLAIMGATGGAGDLEIALESADEWRASRQFRTSSSKAYHSRSISHDLEVEFLETGHSTFTPLSPDVNGHPFDPTFLLPDSTSSSQAPSPCAMSIFASDSNESHESSTSTETGSTTATMMQHRSPLNEQDFEPALEELSEYFTNSCNTSNASSSAPSTPPALPLRHQHQASLLSLVPPAPISPLRAHAARFSSVPSSPGLDDSSARPSSISVSAGAAGNPKPFTRTHKRQSASFAAAQRAREDGGVYDWI
ncbi:hypothetical protein JCM11641_005535 [Rhodosporidiobolus odoratus]